MAAPIPRRLGDLVAESSPQYRPLGPEDFQFKIKLKPIPPPVSYDCPICQRTITVAQTWFMQREGISVPFGAICSSCNSGWSSRGSSEIPRVDRLPFRALNAITNALEWEIKNGR